VKDSRRGSILSSDRVNANFVDLVDTLRISFIDMHNLLFLSFSFFLSLSLVPDGINSSIRGGIEK